MNVPQTLLTVLDFDYKADGHFLLGNGDQQVSWKKSLLDLSLEH